MAEFLAAFIPPLMASEPPVKKPAITVRIKNQPFAPIHNLLIPISTLKSILGDVQKSCIVVGRHTSIIRILLLPQSLDRAIERREQTAPDPEIASQDWRAGFYGCEGADATFAVGGVAEAFYAVPDCATDTLCKKAGD